MTDADSAMKSVFRSSPRPISQFVAMLMLCILVPVLAFGATMVMRVGALDQERANQQALQVATSVSGDIDRDLDGSIESLLGLSTSQALESGNLALFYDNAKQAMAYRKLHVFLRGLDGQQVLNTRVPFGTAIPRQDLTEADKLVISRVRQKTISGWQRPRKPKK